MQGLRIRLEGESEAGVASMTDASALLAAALADAALRVQSLSVGRPVPQASPASSGAFTFRADA